VRVGALVDAEERLPAPAGEQPGDGLVREDHQLLDQRVRVRLRLEPGLLDAAAAVERERDLRARDAERAACEAPLAELERDLLGKPEPFREVVVGLLAAGEDRLRLPVAEPSPASDHGAVERRLAGLQRHAEGHFDRDAQPLDVRSQRTRVVGELVREHRRDEPRDVDGERALGRAAVERRACRHEPRHVRDVDPDPDPVALALHRDRVVEVLRGLGVDREREQVAQVDAALEARLAERERLERVSLPLVLEQALEHGLDPVGGPERALEPRPPSPRSDDGEVSLPHVAEALAVEHDRHAGREVRLPDHELAAAAHLDDEKVSHPRIFPGCSPVYPSMASSFGALLLAGGLGGAVAFLLGLAFARSANAVLVLGALGAALACAFQVLTVSDELADPLVLQLVGAAGTANGLGWIAGTLLVARVRALERLSDAQEAA
jgi:hypothetical protein